MKYAGFWRRLAAGLLDLVILIPYIILTAWMYGRSPQAPAFLVLPAILFGLWFHVYLVRRYGATPGKLLMGLRIVRLDGESVGYKEAILRYLPVFVTSSLVAIALALGSWQLSHVEYMQLTWQQRSFRMQQLAPSWYRPLFIFEQIWFWSEFLVMLTNKKRRAIHDFIAGTVVIVKNTQETEMTPETPEQQRSS